MAFFDKRGSRSAKFYSVEERQRFEREATRDARKIRAMVVAEVEPKKFVRTIEMRKVADLAGGQLDLDHLLAAEPADPGRHRCHGLARHSPAR